MIKYLVDKYDWKESDKAIGVMIKRISDGTEIEIAWFPKSTVEYYAYYDGRLKIRIPKWLLDKKLEDGYDLKYTTKLND